MAIKRWNFHRSAIKTSSSVSYPISSSCISSAWLFMVWPSFPLWLVKYVRTLFFCHVPLICLMTHEWFPFVLLAWSHTLSARPAQSPPSPSNLVTTTAALLRHSCFRGPILPHSDLNTALPSPSCCFDGIRHVVHSALVSQPDRVWWRTAAALSGINSTISVRLHYCIHPSS